ncbi:WxL protein peptidoglycan domain-containing protein [Promicromonospora sp. NPDC057488]|uniref:WxL protein peptidoglycan domain-containing protein n=1 Tax=Promicromonospora sp. NPDC057488 TaxID=3346147 RepID=UPI00366C13DD
MTWGVRTATNDQGTDRENFRYTVDPGSAVSDELVVTNHGEGTLSLDVYAADGYTTTAGQLDVLTRDEESPGDTGAGETGADETGADETGSVNVGAWLEPGVGQVRLEPGESADVPFTLRVPDDATPGDYAGAILTSRTVTADEAGLDYETRSGIRVYLRVAGDLEPSLTVTDTHVEYHQTLNPFGPGDATVTYTVRNDGNVRLAANQDVTVAGPFGWLAARAAADDLPELLPGETWPVSVPVDGVAPLFWLGTDIVLVAQLPDVAGATPGVAPVEAHATGWAVPWLPLAIVVLLAGAVVVIVRRRRTRGQREDARVQAAVAKALAEQAAGAGTSSAEAETGSGTEPGARPGAGPGAESGSEPETEPKPEESEAKPAETVAP